MAGQVKQRSRNLGMGIRPTSLARWSPNWLDLLVVALSWALVVAALTTATTLVTPERGLLYFAVYAIVGATVFGLGVPLLWMVFVRRRPISDLGLTARRWRLSLVLQAVLAMVLYLAAYRGAVIDLPPTTRLLPLVALALAIGFFEAVFWRGWVLLRLVESFGIVPAVLLGSLLYAAYHVGYGMDTNEMVFLFFIGIMFSVVFLVTRSVLILWPVFQPMGQLVTLVQDRLTLPFLATVGFGEVLIAMVVMAYFAGRYQQRRSVAPRRTA
jgi:uncharacterized protein